jgi:hypothetical protein
MKLKYLCLDENYIKNFNYLYCLSRLQHLFVRYNKISDYSEIENLQSLVVLKELDLSNNPISRKYGCRLSLMQKIPSLLYLDGQVSVSMLTVGNHSGGAREARVRVAEGLSKVPEVSIAAAAFKTGQNVEHNLRRNARRPQIIIVLTN